MHDIVFGLVFFISLWKMTPAIEDPLLSACFTHSVFLPHLGRRPFGYVYIKDKARLAQSNVFEPIKSAHYSQTGLTRLYLCTNRNSLRFKRDSAMPTLFLVHKSICHSSFVKPPVRGRFEGPVVHRLKGGHSVVSLDGILCNSSTKQVDDMMDVDQALEEVT
jgi:hypothetical protein